MIDIILKILHAAISILNTVAILIIKSTDFYF